MIEGILSRTIGIKPLAATVVVVGAVAFAVGYDLCRSKLQPRIDRMEAVAKSQDERFRAQETEVQGALQTLISRAAVERTRYQRELDRLRSEQASSSRVPARPGQDADLAACRARLDRIAGAFDGLAQSAQECNRIAAAGAHCSIDLRECRATVERLPCVRIEE